MTDILNPADISRELSEMHLSLNLTVVCHCSLLHCNNFMFVLFYLTITFCVTNFCVQTQTFWK